MGDVLTEPVLSSHLPELSLPSRRGRRADPIILHPEPLWELEQDPGDFHKALDAQISRHGDSCYRLHKAVTAAGAPIDHHAIVAWRRGAKTPQTASSLKTLAAIEHRYRLEPGYFTGRMRRRGAIRHQTPKMITASESRRLAWHLPDDFQARSATEQAEIVEWVRKHIISGGTEYRRYQSEAARHRFGFRFDGNGASWLQAPAQLAQEIAALRRFKSSTLTDIGFERSGVWGEETAAQRTEHLALMFGAMAAPREGEVRGLDVPPEILTLGLLVFPAVWDWYVQWREQRRGFYTGWETEMLLLAAAFTRERTGWLRQNPIFADRLAPIQGLVSEQDIAAAKADWEAVCEVGHRHTLARAREVQRVARVHRDPFEPILPILEAASPVGEYRKIADEVLRQMPNDRRYPARGSRGGPIVSAHPTRPAPGPSSEKPAPASRDAARRNGPNRTRVGGGQTGGVAMVGERCRLGGLHPVCSL